MKPTDLVPQMERYNKALAEEPFYTAIPKRYWEDNHRIKTYEYVKEKLGIPQSQPLTIPQLYKACVKFPEICAWWMLGIHLRPYQHLDIDLIYANRYTAKACSRRLGKTFVNRIVLLHTSRFNLLGRKDGGTTWNVVLQDQDVANDLYIEPLHEMMEKGNQVVEYNFKGKLGKDFWTRVLLTPRDKVGKVKINKISMRVPEEIEFGINYGICRISTFPPTKKVIGREGNLMGDEVSKWKDNPKCKDEFKFFDQLIAILKDDPTYKGIFSSTPEGDDDLFAVELFDCHTKLPKHDFVKVWFPYWARQEQIWLDEMKKTEEKAIANRRLYMFQQEYEAKFLTVSRPFFDPDLIHKNTIEQWSESYCLNTPCSLGIDWGGTESSETAWVITKWDTKKDSIRKPIAMKTYDIGQDLEYLEKDLLNIKRRFSIKWVTPDNKGGRWMIPRLEAIFGKHRVNCLNFTTEKKAGYELLRQGLADKKVVLPNDTKLLKQMLNLDVKLKPSTSKGKDDLIDALMLSCYPLLNQDVKEFKVLTY